MKVAYISSSCFSDVDLSYLSAAQKHTNIHYFLIINPYSTKDVAVNLKTFKKQNGIFKACELYPELENFNKIIDKEKFYVINTSSTRAFHLSVIWTNILLFFFLLKNRYNVIHITHFLYWNQWILFLLKRKIVLTVHDPIPHSTDVSKSIDRRRNINLKYIKNLILLNTKQRIDFVEKYKLKNHQIYQSMLGSYNYLHMYDSKEVAKQDYILFFGRINRYKGIVYLLEAMELVHNERPNLRLIVAGSGEMYFDTFKYQQLDYIQIINRFIPDYELVNLISNSLYIVCPYTDATQSGVIMSAYAYSKPVIATNVGGLPEMVEHEKNGLIVEPKNSKSLAEAMIKLDNQELLAKFISAISQKYQTGKYSWSSISKDIAEIYNKIYNIL